MASEPVIVPAPKIANQQNQRANQQNQQVASTAINKRINKHQQMESTKSTNPIKPLTAAEFWAGKRFDYNREGCAQVVETNLRFVRNGSKLTLQQGNKIIGEVVLFNAECIQLNAYWFGGIRTAYVNFKDCYHHRPSKLFRDLFNFKRTAK